MSKIKVLALFGKSGAGKDTIQKCIVSQTKYKDKVKGIVSCTTRPKREKEIDGIDYHFLKDEEFYPEDMIEYTKFRNWNYGTPFSELDKNKINVGVFNIEGIKTMMKDSRLLVVPVFIDASDKTRLLRVLEREDSPNCTEICRRFLADNEDFTSHLSFIHLKYINKNSEVINLALFDDIILNGQIPKFKD